MNLTREETLTRMKALCNRLFELSDCVAEDELVALEDAIAAYEVALRDESQNEPWESEADFRYEMAREERGLLA